MNNLDFSLYLVTDSSFLNGRKLVDVVEQAVKGGVTMVQLREKSCSSLEFYLLARDLKEVLDAYHIPLIINDRLDIALAVDAAGLHIGQSDLPYQIARKLLGKDKIIGLSVESEADALEANKLDVDYIGISPVFSTSTKTDTAPALGLDGAKSINQKCIHPSVGIGGINLVNVADVIKTGCDGISIVSAIMGATNPTLASQEFARIINQIKNNINETI